MPIGAFSQFNKLAGGVSFLGGLAGAMLFASKVPHQWLELELPHGMPIATAIALAVGFAVGTAAFMIPIYLVAALLRRFVKNSAP